jgi:hypothetical protein
LWTETGCSLSWSFENSDERDLRDLLGRIDHFKADPVARSAVLLGTGEDGTKVGAWNREGAAHLQALIEVVPRDAVWMDVRNALSDAVSGP